MDPRRAAVVATVRTWIGTPFRHAANVRGMRGGVDCGMLVLAVYQAHGLLPAFDPRPYPRDWCIHRTEDWFTPFLRTYAVAVVGEPLPGDCAFFTLGRAALAHAGIVTAWPRVVHADGEDGVREQSALIGALAGRYRGAWRPAALGPPEAARG
jgi:cell wall-associated NlpC family hydrolase